MSSSRIDFRDEFVALDSNEYHFALRRDPRFPACSSLLFEHVFELRIHVPLQVLKELNRRLREDDVRRVFTALEGALECRVDYEPGDADRVRHWEQLGARKGDAVIITQLESAGVGLLVSENRHFLREVPDLPFAVLAAQNLLEHLAGGSKRFSG